MTSTGPANPSETPAMTPPATACSNIRPMQQVRAGDQGRLVVIGTITAAIQRLMSMGLMPGVPVKVSRVAPLGDPIILDCPGMQISLRKGEADGLALEYPDATGLAL